MEEVKKNLEKQGLHTFLDRSHLKPGQPWPPALEEALESCRAVAVFLGPQGMGSWQLREMWLALGRQTSESGFPVIPVLLPGGDPPLGLLGLNDWVDLRKVLDYPLALEGLAAAIRGEAPDPKGRLEDPRQSVCPYRGLRHFREEDSQFFLGREAFTQRLAEAVSTESLVAVVGASGSGKSSVVRAGLLPLLRRGHGGRVWESATLVPGDRPLYALASALSPLLEPESTGVERLKKVAELANALGSGDVALRDVVTGALENQPGTDRLLLLVDQWEEIYTSTPEGPARRRFVDQLLDATAAGRLTVVLTVRGDFYQQILDVRPLADRISNVNLGPMTSEELKQAIEVPARKVGLKFEEGLIQRILDDVEAEPGNLPLLEFVLTELWGRRDRGLLLHEAYESIGRVRGAIAQRAEEVFGALSRSDQAVARQVVTQLVRPGKNTEATRRRGTLAELEAARPVVRELADARLLVTGRDPGTGEETIELAHDALIRHWERLRGWLAKDNDLLLWRTRLRQAREEWERTGRDRADLLGGARLAEAEELRDRYGSQLSAEELRFIKASGRHFRRARRRVRMVAAILAVLALGFATAAFLAFRQAEKTRQEEQTALRVSDFMEDLFEASNPWEEPDGEATARELLDKGAKKVQEQSMKPVVKARLMNVIGRVYYRLGDYEEAEEQLEAALELRQTQPGAGDRDEAQILNDLANVYEEGRDRLAEAEQYFKRSLEIRKKRDPSKVAQSLNNLANLYRLHEGIGRFEKAEELYQRALEIREKAADSNARDVESRRELAESLSNLGELYRMNELNNKAEPLHRRALEIREEVLSQDHPEVAQSHGNLGIVLEEREAFEEAERHYRRALRIFEKALGHDHLEVALCLDNLASVRIEQDDHEEAERFYLRALEIRKEASGPHHPDVAVSEENLGDFYYDREDDIEAEAYYQRALRILQRSGDRYLADVARIHFSLANLVWSPDRLGEAEQHYRHALEIYHRLPGSEEMVCMCLESLTELYQEEDRHSEAAALAHRARTLCPRDEEPASEADGGS